MCGRFTLTASPRELARHFELEETPELRARFNAAPGQAVASVRRAGGRVLEMRRWGLVPPWVRDPRTGLRCINARAESADRKAAFRRAYRERRCLVPADGFYEWGRGSGLPYRVTLGDGALFGFAGLWEEWRGPEGEAVDSCAILTTEASEPLQRIHGRMPVILDAADYAAWLDPDLRDAARIAGLLGRACREGLRAQRVGRRVNDVAADDAGLLEPLPEVPEPAQLGLDL